MFGIEKIRNHKNGLYEVSYADQFRSRIKLEDVKMEKELGNEEQVEAYDFRQ